jgi:anhydro-N-acetylmuramic acid kinase
VNHAWRRLLDFDPAEGRVIVGLMSGMSMDGVDLACVHVSGSFPDLKCQLLGTHFVPFEAGLQSRLLEAREARAPEVSALNVAVAEAFAACVREFREQRPKLHIDAIASHGQTIFHQSLGGSERSTLQVGSPSLIAELCGLPCLGNFRVRDLAVGGQGAPLVAFADYVLYRPEQGCLALNNLGSISNATVVTPHIDELLSCDLGPASLAIDVFARGVAGSQGYDRDGALSAQGRVHEGLLVELLRNPFFALPPPKAAGYQDFAESWLLGLAARYSDASPNDLVRTGVEFCARSTAEAYERWLKPKFPQLGGVLFSGGGTYNRTLMARLRALMPTYRIEVLEADEADAKEAVAFALLGYQTLCGEASNVPQATGASKRVVLGELAL